MTDISRVPFSNVATQQYEPFIYAGQSFGEVHWLPTTSGGKGQLYTGLWKHGCATFELRNRHEITSVAEWRKPSGVCE